MIELHVDSFQPGWITPPQKKHDKKKKKKLYTKCTTSSQPNVYESCECGYSRGVILTAAETEESVVNTQHCTVKRKTEHDGEVSTAITIPNTVEQQAGRRAKK